MEIEEEEGGGVELGRYENEVVVWYLVGCRGGGDAGGGGVWDVFVLRVGQLWVVFLCEGAQAYGLWGGQVHVLRVVVVWIMQLFAAWEA